MCVCVHYYHLEDPSWRNSHCEILRQFEHKKLQAWGIPGPYKVTLTQFIPHAIVQKCLLFALINEHDCVGNNRRRM